MTFAEVLKQIGKYMAIAGFSFAIICGTLFAITYGVYRVVPNPATDAAVFEGMERSAAAEISNTHSTLRTILKGLAWCIGGGLAVGVAAIVPCLAAWVVQHPCTCLLGGYIYFAWSLANMEEASKAVTRIRIVCMLIIGAFAVLLAIAENIQIQKKVAKKLADEKDAEVADEKSENA